MGTKVLRIQHKKDGSGPFTSDNPYVRNVVDNISLPEPISDKGFDEAAVSRLKDEKASPIKFAFKDEEQMGRTFTPEHLTTLKQHGYEPTWVDAKDTWHSGRQVMYTTHEGDEKHAKQQDALKTKTKFKQFDANSPEVKAMNKTIERLRERLEKAKTIRRKKDKDGNFKEVKKLTDEQKHTQAIAEKLQNDPEFKEKARSANAQEHADKKIQQYNQDKAYDEAVATDDADTTPVATKKRGANFIIQAKRRKDALADKVITQMDKQKNKKEDKSADSVTIKPKKQAPKKEMKAIKPLKRSLKERWEDLKKAMNMGGIGGVGSVKAGNLLPNRIETKKKSGLKIKSGKGIAPESKKDPIKSAQQTQNKDIKDMKLKEAQQELVIKPLKKSINDRMDEILKKGNFPGRDFDSEVDVANNAKRKQKNMGNTQVAGMPHVKKDGKQGGSGKVSLNREVAKQKAMSARNPTKILGPDGKVKDILHSSGKKKGKSIFIDEDHKNEHLAELNASKDSVIIKSINNRMDEILIEWMKFLRKDVGKVMSLHQAKNHMKKILVDQQKNQT
jgi:hypothetical protein